MKPYDKPGIEKHEPLCIVTGTSGDTEDFGEPSCKGACNGEGSSYWY